MGTSLTLKRSLVTTLLASSSIACGSGAAPEDTPTRETSSQALFANDDFLAPKLNYAGFARTATTSGAVDTSNPFFQSLGTNGRACATCHQVGEGWSITPAGLQLRFLKTDGTDPIFQPHDTANAPTADVSTVAARWKAYSLLLERGVIRVGLPVKADAEFELAAVDDPYGFASATQLSLFRRPLPTTNLRNVAALNWDGRNNPAADPTNILLGLKNQSNGATINHAKATAPLADEVREAIAAFETSLATTQEWTWRAGPLRAHGAQSGPEVILPLPLRAADAPVVDPPALTPFAAWASLPESVFFSAQEDIVAGATIFNTKPFGALGGTCASCHNAAEIGGNTSQRLFDVKVSRPERRAANVPLYTFKNKATGELVQTTDPGRALVSGKWADMNKFKVPNLRALAARAPFFHDGSARTLGDVVAHYDATYVLALTAREKMQLERFLEAL